jgi:hypothetical protein
MAETATVQPELGGGAEEPKGPPIPEVSDASAVTQPSGQQVDVEALVEKVAAKLLPAIEDAAGRKAQSLFDQKTYQFERMAEKLKEAGGDPKKAAQAMALERIVERELAGEASAGAVPGRTAQEEPDIERKTAEFLNDLKERSGIELTDEEVESIWKGKRYAGPSALKDAFRDVEAYAWKKARQATVTPAAAAAPSGGSPASKDEAALTAELADIQAGKRGSPTSPENKKRREEIRQQLRKS